MQVAVEHAVDHGALHQRHHRGANHFFGVDARVLHAHHVVEVEALQLLHHQHAPSDQRGVRARHHVAVVAQLVQHRRDVDHVGGLHAEVELFDDRLGEQLDQRRRVGQ